MNCERCGRESYLWSGDTCDVCDRDSDGIVDIMEPMGIGPIPHTPLLFQPEDKGWLVCGATMRVLFPEIPIMSGLRLLRLKQRLIEIYQRRFPKPTLR